MARPSKYDEALAKEICGRLRAGCTRRAACLSNGISTDTFARWLKSAPGSAGFADFAAQVEAAEAECEVRNTAMISKAAFGFDATRTTKTVKTVVKVRKSRFPAGGTVRTTLPDGSITKTDYPRGTILEEPVALEEVSEQTSVVKEFDWHAALEWLKRRRRLDWGDKVEIDWKSLTSEQILEILLRCVPEGSGGNPAEGRGGSAAAGTEPAGASLAGT